VSKSGDFRIGDGCVYLAVLEITLRYEVERLVENIRIV
jgi:hypothetical protein